mmetsp:Transcript_54451/g.143399  ORF Transcript_54451/g.143399 Transcript_54451/m.143399 type:complete len:326 (+) Transcript_54451:81-1058(+)
MASAAKYANEDAAESERPLKVCAEAGRKCVRNIQQYPVLSVEWIALVDSLKQLTRLVQMEGRMPANTKVGEAQGRNKDSDGTLWDQEVHENAIRILVEEAKVNLCLRMMNDFKRWQYDPVEKAASFAEVMQAYDYSQSQLEQKCHQFEEALGSLLWRAFVHVETLQLMDIPLLIEHCAMVLQQAQTVPDKLPHAKMQEMVVLYYFSALMKHAENLNNSELLAKAREFELVALSVNHVQRFHEEYPMDIVLSLAEGFAALSDNEDFRTEWHKFFQGPDGQLDREAMEKFMMLEAQLATPVIEAAPERKKDIRPLLDFCKLLQRHMK